METLTFVIVLLVAIVVAAAVGVVTSWTRSAPSQADQSERRRLQELARFEEARKQAKHPPEKLFVDFLANGQISARTRPLAIYLGDAIPVLKTHTYKLEE